MLHHNGSTNFAGYDFTYDVASRITSIDSLVDGLTTYTHDATGQLTGADHTSQTDESYSYDENGNRIMSGYSVGDNNQLLSDGTYNYEYDDEGNRTAKENIATGERIEYEWDHRDRLTKITFKDSLGNVTKTVEQSYDVFNQWIRRQVDDDGPGPNAAVDTFFAYEDGQIVLEFDGATAADLSHRYLWGPAVDQILADEQVTSMSSAGNTLWALTDHLNTVRDIADRDGSTGTVAVANHIDYDSFGNVVSESNTAIDLLIGFTGRPRDEATELQNNLNRWYDADVGQWASEDPVGFWAGDTHLRRYVGHSAIDATDPTGLEDEDWHHKLVKAILFRRGFIDENGNTTDKVTGGSLNVHSKEHGIMLSDDHHKRKPDGVHCKGSDGGADGMTYDKHFDNELNKRIKPDGTISVDGLKAAGEATAAKYPKQIGSAKPASVDYPNRGLLGRRKRPKGSVDIGDAPAVRVVGAQIVSQVAVQQIQNRALDSYYSGETENFDYPYGRMLDRSLNEQDYHRRVALGQDPDVEALPWYWRWLKKLSSSATMCHDNGGFMK